MDDTHADAPTEDVTFTDFVRLAETFADARDPRLMAAMWQPVERLVTGG